MDSAGHNSQAVTGPECSIPVAGSQDTREGTRRAGTLQGRRAGTLQVLRADRIQGRRVGTFGRRARLGDKRQALAGSSSVALFARIVGMQGIPQVEAVGMRLAVCVVATRAEAASTFLSSQTF